MAWAQPPFLCPPAAFPGAGRRIRQRILGPSGSAHRQVGPTFLRPDAGNVGAPFPIRPSYREVLIEAVAPHWGGVAAVRRSPAAARLRGNDQDREAEAPKTGLPEVALGH